MSLPSRNIRKTLQPKTIQELATDYVLMTQAGHLRAGEGVRPRIYTAQDVHGELKLRIGAVRTEREIAKVRETMKMFDV